MLSSISKKKTNLNLMDSSLELLRLLARARGDERSSVRRESKDSDSDEESRKKPKKKSTFNEKDLAAAFFKLDSKETFVPGDLVKFKTGMQNKKQPAECGIVIEVLAEPIFGDTKETGSPMYREPLDIIIGVILNDGDFCTFHLDSRRLTHYDETNDALSTMYQRYQEPSTFVVGDIVRWKKGMKNKKMPKNDMKCVVTKVMNPPIIGDLDNPGSQFFREKLGCVLGFLDSDGDFMEYHFDASRFEKVSHVDSE